MPAARSEADTREALITPALYGAGWGEDLICREETLGGILLDGYGGASRGRKRVDYVLRVRISENSQPVAVAVIEAKKESATPGAGLEQARGYAKRMHVPFVFSSNGHLFVEYDSATGEESQPRPMSEFPAPDELRKRYENARGFSLASEEAGALLAPYLNGEGARRYYQDAAIRAALEKTALNKKNNTPPRVLLNLATGAGKTFIAAHLLKRMYDAGQVRRALFLCDRDELRKQAYKQFHLVFGNDVVAAKSDGAGGNEAENARVHIATYQTLGIDDEQGNAAFGGRHYPQENYFSHIIIDECHRSAWNKWSQILVRNSKAAHIGLTATPRKWKGDSAEDEEISAHNLNYFGEPVYQYTLTQGAEDGYLALCEIQKSNVDIDNTGVSAEELLARSPKDYRTRQPLTRESLQKMYDEKDYENILMLPDRVEAMCGDLFNHLCDRGDPRQKTIIFCVRREHAEMTTAAMNNLYAKWREQNNADAANPYAFVCMGGEGADSVADFRTADRHHFAAATVDLLTTGVDIPRVSCIAFFKYVRSPIALNQMIGRGARIAEEHGKFSFLVCDYTNATDLLNADEWRIPRDRKSGGGKPAEPPPLAVVDGFEVRIGNAGRYVLVKDENGATVRLSAEQYKQRTIGMLLQRISSLDEFRQCWIDPAKRKELMDYLRSEECGARTLAALLDMGDFDDFDVLAASGFGAMARTRKERAAAFDYKSKEWRDEFGEGAGRVLAALARQFGEGGTEELENPAVFNTPLVKKAGGVDALAKEGEPSELLQETKKRIFAP